MSKFVGLLESIEKCLKTFGLPVYYGRSFAKQNDAWNYIVFNRQSFNKSGTRNLRILKHALNDFKKVFSKILKDGMLERRLA